MQKDVFSPLGLWVGPLQLEVYSHGKAQRLIPISKWSLLSQTPSAFTCAGGHCLTLQIQTFKKRLWLFFVCCLILHSFCWHLLALLLFQVRETWDGGQDRIGAHRSLCLIVNMYKSHLSFLCRSFCLLKCSVAAGVCSLCLRILVM